MFLQITFKAVPWTAPIKFKGTFNSSIYTNSVVFIDMYNVEQVKAAAPPVSARVLLSSGDVFQSHTPDL